MRVLHMIPDIGISNGVMSVILNYAKAMPESIKFDVVYFSQQKKTRQQDIEALGGKVYKINPPSPKTALKGEMDKFFFEHKGEWEVLHIHAPHFVIFIAPVAKRFGIKKICCHCHSTLFSLNPSNLKRNKILNKPAKFLVDKRFACSKAAGDYWYKNNYEVIKNAVDCNKYRYDERLRNKVRNELNLNNKFVVGHIGRTDVIQKNHSFLLYVFYKIKKKNENSVLLLIGAEPTQELTQLCNKYGIKDSIIFLGMRNDVNELLQAVDVFVFPSTNEGLPVSVIEAQAAGLPVLMSNSITDEVMVTDNICALSLNDSVDKWADKIVELSEADKTDTFELMKSSGWEITQAAEPLINYYLS